MYRITFGIAVYSLFAISALSADKPVFDTATVKPSPVDDSTRFLNPHGIIRTSPGAVTMQNIPLSFAMAWAYGIRESQIFGPEWITGLHFEVQGKAGSAISEDQLKAMMQSLLEERFHLILQRGQKQLPIYALVVAKSGPKFSASPVNPPPATESTSGRGGRGSVAASRMTLKNRTMPQFAEYLNAMGSFLLEGPVVDATGLAGEYDVPVDMSTLLRGRGGDVAESRPLAAGLDGLLTPLGLQLEQRKASLETITVESGDKNPVQN